MNATEYLPTESEHHAQSSNGNGNGNGLTPAQRAWQTAKDRAVEEATGPFYIQRDEEIRALFDTRLSPGAARLFGVICKLAWLPQFGGRYKGRIGSLCLKTRDLAKYCGGANVKSFYRKVRKEKRDERGALLRPRTETLGWIEELIANGYVWVSRHRIPNIQQDKWLNVYNVAVLHPRSQHADLPWIDGGFGSENVHSTLSHGDGADPTLAFGPKITNSNGPYPQNGTGPSPATEPGRPPQRNRAVPRNGTGPSPATEPGRPPQRNRAVPQNGTGPSPATGLFKKTKEADQGFQTSKGEGTAPPGKKIDSEKIYWDGRNWFPTALHKQLSLLQQEIAGAEGSARRELVAKKHSLLVALGIKSATAKTPAPRLATTTGPAPTMDVVAPLIAKLREAAR